jgi:hypothetical protein
MDTLELERKQAQEFVDAMLAVTPALEELFIPCNHHTFRWSRARGLEHFAAQGGAMELRAREALV